MEAIIHTRALTLFGSISRLKESSTEKSLARRQLSVKSYAGNSWFVEIRRLCVKYSLPDPNSILDILSKCQWKRVVQRAIYTYWADILKQRASLYSSLKFLFVDGYWPGKKHLLIQNVDCVSNVPRIHSSYQAEAGHGGLYPSS